MLWNTGHRSVKPPFHNDVNNTLPRNHNKKGALLCLVDVCILLLLLLIAQYLAQCNQHIPMSKLLLFTKNSAKYDDLNGAFSVYYYSINAMANDTPNLWHFYSAHNSSSSIVFLTMCIWSLSKDCSRGYGEWFNSGLWRWYNYIGTYLVGSALQFFYNFCSWQGPQPTSTQNMLRGPWKCVWATRYTQVHNNKPLILWCLARFMCKVGS